MNQLEDVLFEDIFEKEIEFKRENTNFKSVRGDTRLSRGFFRDTNEASTYKNQSIERTLP